MSPSSVKTILVVVVFVVALQLCAESSGEALLSANCSKCHGRDGAGKTAAAARFHIPNLASDSVQSLPDTEIYDSIARGIRHKEYPHGYEYRGMSHTDIESLVKYIRILAKK